ncbi:MAG: hypothetical protein DDG59_08690 [Anaerolineae bacterium]|jgi:hypothetical protein|nr:MAG: hypothetical protein DDG59_08690 [Anaerolineae bacterium]
MNSDNFSTLFALLCGGGFVLVFGVLGIWLIITSRKQRQKAEASQNWPTVAAQIVLSEVRESSSLDEEGDIRRSYFPHVEYTYQVGEMTYRGDKLTFGAKRGYASPKKAQEQIARYPVGAQVRAYYNPENPQEAVLEQRAVGSNFMLIFGIIALLISLCILCALIGSLISNLASS